MINVLGRKLYDGDPYIRAERHLMASLPELLTRVSLADIAVKPRPNKFRPTEYRLVPVSGIPRRNTHVRSTQEAGYRCTFPDDVAVEYWNEDMPGHLEVSDTPHLDTQRGFMLVRNGHAIAIASLCIDDTVQGEQPARARIEQCQGLVRDDIDPEHAEGLRGGFRWRETMYNGCEQIAAMIDGVGSIAAHSAATKAATNSNNATPATVEQLAVYDQTAANRRFDYDQATGLWLKPIAPAR